jgi:hypothetical protein
MVVNCVKKNEGNKKSPTIWPGIRICTCLKSRLLVAVFDIQVFAAPLFGTELLRPAFVCTIVEHDPTIAVLEVPATPVIGIAKLVL